jgi:hypothetical protein
VVGLNCETACNFAVSLFDPDDGDQFEVLFTAAERWPTLRGHHHFRRCVRTELQMQSGDGTTALLRPTAALSERVT